MIDFDELRGLAADVRTFIQMSEDKALALRAVIAGHDVVLGIFPSHEEGIGLHVIKGDELLRQIANSNEAGDYFLFNKLESQVPDENPDEERVLERLSQDSIVDALADVPHDFRDVIVLVDIGEFSYADAAQILDIPIGTVMSRLHRGRRILKKNLADGAVI